MIKTKFEFINEHKAAIRVSYNSTDWYINDKYRYGGLITRFSGQDSFDDPSYWFYTEGPGGGFMPAEALRQIADKIDELNAFEKGLSNEEREKLFHGKLEKDPPID